MAGWIQGTAGNDTLNGQGGDTLQGGRGNDLYNAGNGTVTVRLDADGSRDRIVLADGARVVVQLADGLGPQDLQFVWTRATDTAPGQWALRLSGGRGELLWPPATGPRPSVPPTLEGIELSDGQRLGADVIPGLVATTVQPGLRVEGSSGDDVLRADAWANNVVQAGAGNDTLYSGNDGRYKDRLEGGEGDDTYRISAGWGQDTIGDQQGVNEVRFGPDVPLDSLRFFGFGNNLRIASGRLDMQLYGSGSARDHLEIEQFSEGLAAGTPPVARFVFEADGVTLTAAELYERMLTGTDGNDTLFGLWGDDATLQGGLGDDVLLGPGTNVKLLGGGGRDTLLGGGSEHTFVGGAGDDVMVAAEYIDWGNYFLGASNDTYLFNRGDGADVIFDVEAGFVDTPETHNVLRLGEGIAPEDLDVYLVLRQDPFGVQAARPSIVLQLRGTSEGVVLVGEAEALYGEYHHGVDEVVFADGSTWDRAALIDRAVDVSAQPVYRQGTAGADTLVADADKLVLWGGAGVDTYLIDARPFQTEIQESEIVGPQPADMDEVRFAQGILPADVKVVRLAYGALELHHRAGAKVLIPNLNASPNHFGDPHVRAVFADGTVWDVQELERRAVDATPLNGGAPDVDPPASQLRTGSDGHDTMSGLLLQAGQGDDVLQGVGGQTVSTYAPGDGDDTIRPALGYFERFAQYYYVGSNVVRFEAGITADDLVVNMRPVQEDVSPYDRDTRILLSFKDRLGSLDVVNLERVEFADGSSLDKAQMTALAADQVVDGRTAESSQAIATGVHNDTVWGSVYDDAIRTSEGDDWVAAGEGNDLIDGGAGADVLWGEGGNDTIIGGLGNDTYQFGWFDGSDTLRDHDTTPGNADVIQLVDVSSHRLWLSRDGSDLVLSVLDRQDQIRVEDWFLSKANQIERIVARSDGKALSSRFVGSLVNAMAGFSPQDLYQQGDAAAFLNQAIDALWRPAA